MEQKDNSGVLFRNTNKKTDKHPDYTGECKVDGTDYRLSAWVNTSKTGSSYMSVAFTKKETEIQINPPKLTKNEEPDIDLPF